MTVECNFFNIDSKNFKLPKLLRFVHGTRNHVLKLSGTQSRNGLTVPVEAISCPALNFIFIFFEKNLLTLVVQSILCDSILLK